MGRRRLIFASFGLFGAALAVSSACHDAPKPTTKPEASTAFTILTYNVEFDHGTPPATLDAIANFNADIVCLQECTSDWEKTFRAHLSGTYSEMRFQITTTNDPGGLAILSKFPIESDTRIEPGQRGWFPGSVAIVSTPGGRLQILNVHLRPWISDSGSRVKGFFTVETMHRGEIESLTQSLNPGLPTVVLGDFNEGNDGKATAWLSGKSYADVLPRYDRDTPTWHGPVYGLNASYRDDHIFTSPQISCTGARVLKAGESDHYPVSATIMLSPNNPAK